MRWFVRISILIENLRKKGVFLSEFEKHGILKIYFNNHLVICISVGIPPS